MKRRGFIRDFGILSVGTAAALPILGAGRRVMAAKSASSTVTMVKDSDWAALVQKALNPLGGMEKFIKKGAKVFVKPNMSFDRTPKQAANTHPEVVKAVVKACLDAGAAKVTVADNTLMEKRRSYQNSGIAPALETLKDDRVKVPYLEDRDYTSIKIDKGLVLSGWEFNKHVLEADAYITVPVAKHHGSAKLTLGLKNILGLIGGMRSKIHWKLHQGIADLNTVATPTLTVIDATRILLRHGPSGGGLEDVAVKNTVIASADPVAADSVAAKALFDIEPGEIGYIEAAHKLKLGEMDLSRIKVINA